MEFESKKYYKSAILVLSLVLLGSGVFNFIQRGRNHNLETQIKSLNADIKITHLNLKLHDKKYKN